MKETLSIFGKNIPFRSYFSVNRRGVKRVMRNLGWLFFEKILRLVLGLAVGVWVARYLQPERFGILSYAIAFSALFTPLAKLGLDGIVVRELVRKPKLAGTILGTGFALKLGGGILVIACACFFQFLMDPSDTQILLLVGIIAGSALFQAFDIVDLWFQSQVNSKYAVIPRNIAFILFSLFRVVLIFSGAGIVWFAVAEFSNFLLAGIGLVIVYLGYTKSHAIWRFDSSKAWKLLEESWPLILQGLVIMVYMRVDQIMLKEMIGPREVGIYSVSVRLTEFWYFIPMMLTQSLFPAIIHSKNLGESIYLKRIQDLYTLLIWSAISMALVVTIFSHDIVRLLFGSAYQQAGAILALHIWLGCSVFFGVARQKWIIAEKKLKTIMSLSLIGCLMNVLGNALLIPVYGAIGSAASSLIAAIGANLVVAFFSPTIRFSLQMYGVSLLFPFQFLWTAGRKRYRKG
jgi:PST family polysaccharide transporter